MWGWHLILMNPIIAFDFKDGQFENILLKSQDSPCNFIYFDDADSELVDKLKSIYEEDATNLRNVSFKA